MTFRRDDLSQNAEYKALCVQENEIQKQLTLLQQELNKITEKKRAFESNQKIDDEEFDYLLRKKLPALGITKTQTDATRGIVEIAFHSDVSKVTVKMQLKPYLSDITIVDEPGFSFNFAKKLKISFKLSDKDACVAKLQQTEDKPSITLKSYY